jgi:hypothetical protein
MPGPGGIFFHSGNNASRSFTSEIVAREKGAKCCTDCFDAIAHDVGALLRNRIHVNDNFG